MCVCVFSYTFSPLWLLHPLFSSPNGGGRGGKGRGRGGNLRFLFSDPLHWIYFIYQFRSSLFLFLSLSLSFSLSLSLFLSHSYPSLTLYRLLIQATLFQSPMFSLYPFHQFLNSPFSLSLFYCPSFNQFLLSPSSSLDCNVPIFSLSLIHFFLPPLRLHC